jgi:hypothetical protein
MIIGVYDVIQVQSSSNNNAATAMLPIRHTTSGLQDFTVATCSTKMSNGQLLESLSQLVRGYTPTQVKDIALPADEHHPCTHAYSANASTKEHSAKCKIKIKIKKVSSYNSVPA